MKTPSTLLWLGLGVASAGCVAERPADSDVEPDVDSDSDTDSDTDTDTDSDTDPQGWMRDVLAFTEVTEAAGILHAHRPNATDRTYRPCSVGDLTTGGVAVADVNADGLDDLFFPVYDGTDRLYINRGDGTFQDQTRASEIPYGRYSTSAAFTDLNDDGRLDLLIARLVGRPLRVYLQTVDGTFEEHTDALGFGYEHPDTRCAMAWSLTLGDVDSDGDLDVLLGVWRDKIHGEPGFGSLLWRREDDGTYAVEPLPVPEGNYGFTPALADLDDDGFTDITLASDFGTNLLLWGEPDGSFRPSTEAAGVHTVEAGMGSALLDLDADGDLDWLVTSVFDGRDDLLDTQPQLGNMAYLNQGDGRFVEGAEALGLARTGWAWGIADADYDLDGNVDLAITNGYDEGPGAVHLYGPFWEDPTALLMRTSPAGVFEDRAMDVGLDHTGDARAIVAFDLENDGDDDVLVIDQVGPPMLFRNDLVSTSGSVTIRLQQAGLNPDGLGSQVWIRHDPDGPSLRHDIDGNASFLSQVPARVRVGIGADRQRLAEVRVVWPNGEEQVFRDVGPGELRVRR